MSKAQTSAMSYLRPSLSHPPAHPDPGCFACAGTNERTAVVFGSTEVVAAAMTQLLAQKLVSEARDAQYVANEVPTPDEELAARLTGQEVSMQHCYRAPFWFVRARPCVCASW